LQRLSPHRWARRRAPAAPGARWSWAHPEAAGHGRRQLAGQRPSPCRGGWPLP